MSELSFLYGIDLDIVGPMPRHHSITFQVIAFIPSKTAKGRWALGNSHHIVLVAHTRKYDKYLKHGVCLGSLWYGQ